MSASEDYLWDPSASADAEILSLEQALRRHRYVPTPMRAGTRRRSARALRRWAIAAALLSVAGTSAWLALRPTPWAVTLVQGSALVGPQSVRDGSLLNGARVLETGAGTIARVNVARIGRVEIGPGSRLRLVQTSGAVQRLALERGELYAHIWARPRAFVVETPAGVATDLGCVYRLRIADDGTGVLGVEQGEVEVDGAGIEVLVSAGTVVTLDSVRGPGVPVPAGSGDRFRIAVRRLAEGAVDSSALAEVLAAQGTQATITLFHLIPRVAQPIRTPLVDGLAARFSLPAGVARDAILTLDEQALGAWRDAMRGSWSTEPGGWWPRQLLRLGVRKPSVRMQL